MEQLRIIRKLHLKYFILTFRTLFTHRSTFLNSGALKGRVFTEMTRRSGHRGPVYQRTDLSERAPFTTDFTPETGQQNTRVSMWVFSSPITVSLSIFNLFFVSLDFHSRTAHSWRPSLFFSVLKKQQVTTWSWTTTKKKWQDFSEKYAIFLQNFAV